MEPKKVSMVLVFAVALFIGDSSPIPTPTPWPEQFHALLYMNLSKGNLQMSDLWYDWPMGRNVNIFQKQLGVVLYDIEWDNGTSFFYTSGARDGESCTTMEFGVGIPRPDFMLDGAEYLGTELVDGGFLCNVWEKVEFIWYYEDVVSKRPVRWDFYDGISSHVITFEEGATLQDSVVEAPSYCFNQDVQLKEAHLRPSGFPNSALNGLRMPPWSTSKLY